MNILPGTRYKTQTKIEGYCIDHFRAPVSGAHDLTFPSGFVFSIGLVNNPGENIRGGQITASFLKCSLKQQLIVNALHLQLHSTNIFGTLPKRVGVVPPSGRSLPLGLTSTRGENKVYCFSFQVVRRPLLSVRYPTNPDLRLQ